jgi:hypothetical protein
LRYFLPSPSAGFFEAAICDFISEAKSMMGVTVLIWCEMLVRRIIMYGGGMNTIVKGEVMPSDDVIGAQKLQRSCCGVHLATKTKYYHHSINYSNPLQSTQSNQHPIDIKPILPPTQETTDTRTHPASNGAPTLRRRQGRPRVHTSLPPSCILALEPYTRSFRVLRSSSSRCHRKHGILRNLARKHTTIKPGTLPMVRLHIRPTHINDDE